MSKSPVLKAREVVAALQRANFIIQHQKGSHIRLRSNANQVRHVTIPMHSKDVPLGTLRRIIDQAGMTVEEFKRFI